MKYTTISEKYFLDNPYQFGNYYEKKRKLARMWMIIILPVTILALWLISTVLNTEIERTEPLSNKFYYRRVVEFIGYEDIVISYSDVEQNILPNDLRTSGRRRLLTLNNPEMQQKSDTIRYRRRRDYYSQTAQYGELYRRHRASNEFHSSSKQNEIKRSDLDDLEANSPNHEQEATDETSHKSSTESNEELSQMERTYRKSLAECEAKVFAANNNNSHGNDTAHNDSTTSGHHDECTREMESGVPALWVLLYIAIILFLFIGLAIICDDFFVASLEAISDRLNLSTDVAGATFMAAGSSAPELFISVAGVGSGSDVGVGTIVGSAVFNLLIIIALTAALAGKVLCLDWRPFVRDSIFYALSIIAFIMFSLDTQFQYWESLALLALYVTYIVTMKFNPQLMDFMAKWTCCSCFETRVSPEDEKEPDPENNSKSAPPSTTKSLKNSSVSPETTPKEPVPPAPVTLAPPTLDRPPSSKTGSIGTKSANDSGICVCGGTPNTMTSQCCVIHVSSQPCNACINRCICSSPALGRSPLQCASCSSIVKEEINVISSNGPSATNGSSPPFQEVQMTEVKNGFLPNAVVSENDGSDLPCPAFNKFEDMKSNGELYENRNNSNRCTCSNSSDSSTGTSNVGSSKVNVLEVSYDEPSTSIDNCGPAEQETKQEEGEAEEGEGTIVLIPCLPAIKNPAPEKPSSSECIPGSKYVGSYAIFILSFPWVCVFTWTVPNCSKPQTRKWYLASFFLCIGWIAFLSFIMIELVEKIGCLLSIDPYTMGLVIVAVGTSVPDAISSILVAKEGYGDMAVSNALGSNVFDINLGLGLPFFLSSIISSKPVSLLSPVQMCLFDSLPLTVKIVPHVKFGFILLLILLIAVIVFMLVRFRLNRQVTILFIVMYFVFMVYAFVQERTCHAFFC